MSVSLNNQFEFNRISDSKITTSKSKKTDSQHRRQELELLSSALLDNNTSNGNANGANGSGNTAIGTNGSNSKNLSHVPCKFYRQGNCQAGTACPFSHNLEGTLGADKLPCKYFQKGNCKFGLKCALAHYLPDGTRVNNKGLLNSSGYSNYRRAGHGNNYRNGNSNNTPSLDNSSSNSNENFVVNGLTNPIDISFNLGSDVSRTASSNFQGQNQLFQQPTHQFKKSNSYSDPYQKLQNPQVFRSYTTGQVPQTSPGGSLSHNSTSNNSFNGLLNNQLTSPNSLTNPNNPTNTLSNLTSSQITSAFSNSSPTNFYLPQLSSPTNDGFNFNSRLNPHSRLSSQSSSSFANGNGLYNFSGNTLQPSLQYSPPLYDYNSSAIVDDDDSLHDASNEDDIFEEDYVPASLSDLILTPQELVRRDLRSQSGTLLVRPNLNNITSNSSVSSLNDNPDDATCTSPHHVHHFQNDAFKKKVKNVNPDVSGNGDDVFLMD